MKPIVIVGVGGFAKEVLDLLRDINRVEMQWDILGFIDRDDARQGEIINDRPVLGGDDWLLRAARKPFAVMGVGSPPLKRKLAERLAGTVAGFPTLIHPTVTCSDYVRFGEGVVVTAGTILTNTITVGDFVMLNLMCTVGHDCRIGDYVTVSPGVSISGHVQIAQGCDIGTGAKIIPGVTIGEWTVVGAGAVVAKNLPAYCTAVGVPARVIKEHPPG